jgi:hypothetical protein
MVHNQDLSSREPGFRPGNQGFNQGIDMLRKASSLEGFFIIGSLEYSYDGARLSREIDTC